jgi:PhnB protein
MHTTSYLFFNGNCAEALDFYKKAAGAVVHHTMTYGDSPAMPHMPPEMKDKLIHASFSIGDSAVMASDCPPQHLKPFGGFALSISVSSAGEADKLFSALSDGGSIIMPLGETFFAKSFGQFTDKFGVMWMVIHEKECA